MRRLMAPFVLLTVLACGGSPTEPSGEQHGPEGGGGEASESGTQYSLTDTAVETRGGVRLTMSYDAGAETFRGEMVNTTSATVTQVRVEIHLSNGVELGPTPRVDLAAGPSMPIELDASSGGSSAGATPLRPSRSVRAGGRCCGRWR